MQNQPTSSKCGMELMCRYDRDDLYIVRKSEIQKMCISFSCKAYIRKQVFFGGVRTTTLHRCTPSNFFSLLKVAQKLGVPVVWLSLWLKIQDLWEPWNCMTSFFLPVSP